MYHDLIMGTWFERVVKILSVSDVLRALTDEWYTIMKKGLYLVTAILIAVYSGCERKALLPEVQKDDPLAVEYLAVESTSPVDGAVNVPLITPVEIRFNDNLRFPDTIVNGATFSVNGGSVNGSFTYDVGSRVLMFTPDSPLIADMTYTVMLTTGIESLAGDHLEKDYQFQFTTIAPGLPVIQVNQSGMNIPYGGTIAFDITEETTSVDKVFSIYNAGQSDLTVNLMSLGGANQDDFSIKVPYAGVIGSYLSETFTLSFNPLNTGEKTAVVYIDSDDSVTPTFEFIVTGTAVAAGSLVSDIAVYLGTAEIANGTMYNLATYKVGEISPEIIFTIYNAGNGDLDINSITLTDDVGGRFIIAAMPVIPSTIPPGTSIAFSLRFLSFESGVFFGTVEIASNDPDEAPFSFRIKVKSK